MTKVEIIKDYKLLKVGDKPNLDDAYAGKLIKTGVAKKVEEKKK